MNWYKLIKVAFVPYGYWIQPNGARIPVQSEAGHLDAIKDQGMYGYEDALSSGWIRIIVRPATIQMEEVATLTQVSVVLAIMEENGIRKVYITAPGFDGGEVDVDFELEKVMTGKGWQVMRTRFASVSSQV